MVTLQERRAHDDYYAEKSNGLEGVTGAKEYVDLYELLYLSPFFRSGNTKGYVRGLATSKLLDAAAQSGRQASDMAVLDAGCGQGELSVYLACNGFNVTGVDLSPVACENAGALARRIGIADRCRFSAEDLSALPVDDASVDYVIGHASLHHFI